MRLSPRLIPRLDVDFDFRDFILSLSENESPRESFEKIIYEFFPEGRILFVDSGRTALFLALKAMNLGKGARVGVPLYLCEVVFDAIVRAGCTPIFMDVDPRTFTLDPKDVERKAVKLDAIIPVHIFGHPSDMDSILTACGNVKMIEDCAHGLGSLYKNKTVGSFGQASFYSFGLGKPISVGRFGLLLCKDDEIFTKASRIYDNFPNYSRFEHVLNSFRNFGRAALYRPPWFGTVSLPVGNIMDKRLDFMDKTGFDPHKAANGSLWVLIKHLRQYPEKLRGAKENAEIFKNILSSTKITPPISESWASHTYFQFALTFETKDARDDAVDILARYGVDSIRFYHDSPNVATKYGYKHDCPVSERIADTVLTIPCYRRLSQEMVNRIAEALRHLGGGG